jgi:hypothetical protein
LASSSSSSIRRPSLFRYRENPTLTKPVL